MVSWTVLKIISVAIASIWTGYFVFAYRFLGKTKRIWDHREIQEFPEIPDEKEFTFYRSRESFSRALLDEYRAANEKIIHYERLTWEIGSVLLAGSLAAMGFLAMDAEAVSPLAMTVVCTVGIWVITVWWQWFERHRRIDLAVYQRLWTLEKWLGLHFNLSVKDKDDQERKNHKWLSVLLAPHGCGLGRMVTILFVAAWFCLFFWRIWKQ